MRKAVLSVSGGLDSTSLMLHLLREGYEVKAYSFDYGQRHSVELDRLSKNVLYLKGLNLPLEWDIIDLKSVFSDSNSSLLPQSGNEIPEGHYEDENMKSTVVENRNAIFASILYGKALAWANKTEDVVKICLGIHAGDHCFSKNTKILTSSGLKTVEDLKIGDQLFSFNFEKKSWESDVCLDVIKKGISNSIVDIETASGHIELTDLHKTYRLRLGNYNSTYGYQKDIEEVLVKDLEKGNYLIQPTNLTLVDSDIDFDLLPIVQEIMLKYQYKTDVSYNDEFVWIGKNKLFAEKNSSLPRKINLVSFANVMAWYISEGWSRKDSYLRSNSGGDLWQATFSQSLSANLEKCEKIKQDLANLQGGSFTFTFTKEESNGVPKEMIVNCSNVLALLLKEGGSHSFVKKIPNFLFQILLTSSNLRREFLFTMGLADGFGTETLYRGFCSTSETLIEQMVTLIQLSGYHFSKGKRQGNTDYIVYSEKNTKSCLISLGDAKFTKINSIEVKPYNDHVYDLSVKNNHNFLGGEYGQILISNSIYPDCRRESRDALGLAFRISNWGSERVDYYTPYINIDKGDVLKDGLVSCNLLGLDFDLVFRNTNTCYNPTPEGDSCGKCGSCTERLEAFEKISRIDPVNYSI